MNSNITIGLPCSPATLVSTESVPVTQVQLSYGGGMGGSNELLYGTIEQELDGNRFIFKTYLGEEIEINRNFVVTIREKRLVVAIVDVTEHKNYNGTVCQKSIQTEYSIVDVSDNVDFVDSYDSDTNGRKVINTVTEQV